MKTTSAAGQNNYNEESMPPLLAAFASASGRNKDSQPADKEEDTCFEGAD